MNMERIKPAGLPQQRGRNEEDPAIPTFFGLHLYRVSRKGHIVGNPEFHSVGFQDSIAVFVFGFSALNEDYGNPASAASHGRTNKVSRAAHGFHNTACLAANRKSECFHRSFLLRSKISVLLYRHMVYTSNKTHSVPIEGAFMKRYNISQSSSPQEWRHPVASPVIHYEDEYLIAVSKPAGMLVHRTRIASGESSFLLQQARDLTGRYLYPVHRLDRPTSGIVLFATTPEAARALSESFRTNAVGKTYIAVVRGWIEERGTIDSALDKPSDEVIGKAKTGRFAPKEALTEYIRLATAEVPFPVSRHSTSRYSLVKLHPLTGRRHQIRRHLRRISHPIIGDVEYGDGRHNRFFRNHFGIRRLLLHAWKITIPHPRTGNPFTVTDPIGPDFRKVCTHLGWEIPEES